MNSRQFESFAAQYDASLDVVVVPGIGVADHCVSASVRRATFRGPVS